MEKEIIEKCRKELELILVIKSIDDITFNNIINLIASERKEAQVEILEKVTNMCKSSTNDVYKIWTRCEEDLKRLKQGV